MQKEKLQQAKTEIENAQLQATVAEQVAKVFSAFKTYIKDTAAGLEGLVSKRLDSAERKIDAKLAAIRQPKDGKDGKQGPKGDKGDKPVQGIDYTIPDPIPGPAGRDGRDGRDIDPSTVEDINETLEEFEKRLNATKPGNGIFIGPSRGIFLYIDGVKKGLINNANFKAGVGVSLAYSKVQGQDTITINASGGGSSGVTVETPTGAVNASNTIFTVSAEPKYVVADGTTYFAGAGYSYAALSVTMDVPPSASIRAII